MPFPAVLVTDSQMDALRTLAKLGMTTEVSIERRTETAPPVGGDYGDDFLAYPETTESRTRIIKGWFFSSPTQVQEVDTGSIITVNTYRLFLPVGTDIQPGDRVHVGDQDYTVSDTTAESTWLPLLTASLRRRE